MSRIKKSFAMAVIAFVAVAVVAPSSANADAVSDLQALIDDLLAQISGLQAQITALGGSSTSGVAGIPAGFTFDVNLSQGSSSQDVMYLQMALNSDSDTQLAASGVGSAGQETQFFGPLTQSAAVKYQEKYTAAVLTPVGLSSGTGFVGPSTRSHLNSWISMPAGDGGVTPPPVGGGDVTPPPAGDNTLQVSLASDTPAGTTVADNANADMTKFVLTAGSTDVSISKLVVTRKGLTVNSDLENVKIIDSGGVSKGSIGSFNVNNQSVLTFNPDLMVKAGQSQAYSIRAGIINGALAGKTVSLGIEANADITSNADSVTGAPVFGNEFDVVQIAIGTANVNEDGTTIDSTPDVGDTDVIALKFKVIAGAAESITVTQITALESGTGSLTDTNNIELFDVTNGVSLGTASAWDSEGKASWSDLNLEIAKGKTQRFKIMVDVVDGPSLTVNPDVIDGSDVLISVMGNTYGFFITPTIDSSWNGKGSNAQTINSGSLTVSKSTNTPAAGNIAAADEQTLVTYDFVAKGEEVKISAATFNFDMVNGMSTTDVTSVKLVDSAGDIVAGPLDLTTASTVAFTDTFFVPVGTNEYSIVANFNSATANGETVDVGLTPSAMTVKGLTSNDSITPTPSSEVEGNLMTIEAGALTMTTLTNPAARSLAQGVADFVFATANLDAGSSGEDVQVTNISVKDDPGAGATAAPAADLNNVEIWADLDSTLSARGDIYETKIADPTDFTTTTMDTAETLAFTLTETVTVPKKSFVEIAAVADLDTAASTAGTHTVNFSAVTSNGADSGQSISATVNGSGQAMTTSGGGTLTVTADSTEPDASLVVGTTPNVDSPVTVAVFRLAADNVEDLDLDSIKFHVSHGDKLTRLYFYNGITLLGSTPPGLATNNDTPVTLTLADGTVTIPANGNVKITVKADVAPITVTGQNNSGIVVAHTTVGDIDTTGLASGNAVDSAAGTVSSKTHTIFESFPSFSVNSSSPSGALITGTAQEVARFDVTAHADEDVTFQKGDGNSLVVSISQSLTDTDLIALETFTLKDINGITLDTVTADIGTAATVTFDFTDQSFTVPAGQTKTVIIEADTTEFEDNGDTLQLFLDDGSATNVDWGIDGTGSYNHADVIFRGDIKAGVLVNPS